MVAASDSNSGSGRSSANSDHSQPTSSSPIGFERDAIKLDAVHGLQRNSWLNIYAMEKGKSPARTRLHLLKLFVRLSREQEREQHLNANA
ncbi:Uncharacterized protein PBTT_08134 [Plasmodiophora brassicae]|uniref:Uncharacterized protein n=1 Tax=Plasmodiophora brassicae TaxID=37360 RepID=A0A0G4IK83_PLABS|nr:hypothetical protein PBRA_004259 [Plasmodiophora brassicae]SPR00407.1 unnamed protein product [Plasmodiophora brassicae]